MSKQTFTTGQILTAAQMTTLQANDYNWTVNAKTASYTLVATDAGTRITMTSASATTITVNTSLFTAGDVLEIINLGAGVCTITAGTATVSTSATLALKQYDAGSLFFNSTSAAVFFSADAADSPLTTKGDLYTYSTTNDRLAVGNNGETLVADSSATSGLRWQTPVQQNPVLNSAFQVWQRGTSIAQTAAIMYGADRWCSNRGGLDVGSTISRQATGDTTNLPNIQYCARVQRNNANTSTYAIYFSQTMESLNSIQFAGKTITVSFYARKGANYSSASSALALDVNSGTGTDQNVLSTYTGAASVVSQTATLTTTWQRFTYTGTVASTATELGWYFSYTPVGTAGAADYFEVTGFQVEVGSVATPFHTYAATIQGELAACQRYFFAYTSPSSVSFYGNGQCTSTTKAFSVVSLPVTMRTTPTLTAPAATNFAVANSIDSDVALTAIALRYSSLNSAEMNCTTASGLVAGNATRLYGTTTSAYLQFSAEL